MPLAAQTTTPKLSLETYPFGDNAGVTFTHIDGSIASAAPQSQNLIETTPGHSYVIAVPPEVIPPESGDHKFFHLKVYIRENHDKAEWYVYYVTAETSGQFLDANSPVAFKIETAANGTEVAKVGIPLHCWSESLLQVSRQSEDRSITVGQEAMPLVFVKVSEEKPGLSLRNQLSEKDGFNLRITSWEFKSTKCPECWEPIKGAGAGATDVIIRPQNSGIIDLGMRPRAFSSIWSTAFVLKGDTPHDILQANVSFHAEVAVPTFRKL